MPLLLKATIPLLGLPIDLILKVILYQMFYAKKIEGVICFA